MSEKIVSHDKAETNGSSKLMKPSIPLNKLFLRELKELRFGLLSILAALALVGIIIYIAGINPLDAYRALIKGSFGSINGISETFVKATPLIFLGLGITIAFRGGMWNIGGDGQLLLGALGATIVGVYFPSMPPVIHIALSLLFGFLFGALWAAIPGYFKMLRGTNEIVITIMLNYLATFLIAYLVSGPMKDTTQLIPVPQSREIAASAILPRLIPLTRIHAGFLIAILAVIVVWFVLQRTVLGYEIKAVGENVEAANYGGINIFRTGFFAMLLSGGFAGIAGMSEISGVHHYLLDGISPGYGYLAIAVALFGGLNPIGVVFSALFFGALNVGAESMQRAVGVPTATVYLLEGLVVIFVLARHILKRRRKLS